nr:hypothetical protein [Cellulophaga omnivescoria]
MKEINYIKHLNGVFIQFSNDSRLNPTHISLYVALFQIWNTNYFKDEFFINREEVMTLSKIGSKSTYHKCIKELSHWNYLLYSPSHNPFRGSRIKMFDFETSDEQVLAWKKSNLETSTEQALVSNNKHIQIIKNSENINKHEIFEILNAQNCKTKEKQSTTDPYQDNLKTSSNKNYDEPL